VNAQFTPLQLAQEVIDLVSLPEIYLRLRELLNDPDYCLTDIADIISVDPGLISRILRVANSGLYNFSSKVEKIPHAVNLLGTQNIHDFILATSVVRSFSGVPNELVDMQKFWRCSVLCGAAAKIFADKRDFLDSEHMFIIGLLTHVGRLVLYLRLPAEIAEAYFAASQEGIPLFRALQTQLGFNDADVAGELMSIWKLPASLIEPVRHCVDPSTQLTETYFEKACIVHIASAIADRQDYLPELESVVSNMDDIAWRHLELDLESVQELITDAESLADEIAGQFLPEPA
jgi:HD-like signal output (HDOD) protein